MKSLFVFPWAVFALLLAGGRLFAQAPVVSPSQTEISVAPGFNHAPARVALSYLGNTAAELGRLNVTSDATWVSGSVDATARQVVLTFSTANLTNRTYTATLTVRDGTASTQFFVRATIATLNIVALRDDPVRSRTYGVQQDGANIGSVVVIDPITLTPIHNITVGKRPTDLAISGDGNEMLVMNAVEKSITAINVRTLAVSETISLATYYDWSSTGETSGHVKYGAGDVIYYIDGSWGPVLHVYNRSTRTVLQSIFFNGSRYAGAGNEHGGFGDLVLNPEKTEAFGWWQYGWSAGSGGSSAGKFTIGSSGTLTPAGTSTAVSTPMERDPLNTPALMSANGKVVVLKQHAFNPSTVDAPVRTFPSPVFALSPGAEIVATASAIYDYSTGNKLYDLPAASTVQTITSDYARLVYFDPTAKALKSVNLLEKIGGTILRRDSLPADGAIVLAPSVLQWAPVTGVDRYRVYLGDARAAVAQAGLSSPELLGTVNTNTFTLPTPPNPGRTYYWRVDVVTDAETVAGQVQSFSVSTIASNVSSIDTATVRGHADLAVPIQLTSATPGLNWSAASTAAWVKFDATAGTTPATLRVSLDASNITPGVSQTDITITTADGPSSIPVRLQVDPLALTVMRSDPRSATVYAISEVIPTSGSGSGANPPTVGTPQAYLLEIDSQAQTIKRVVPVGTSATDLAIHHGDNRIYVPNWRGGALLALNRDTLARERTYAFNPFGTIGSSDGDVYRVSAGGPGRVVLEEYDQWIDIAIYDTVNAKILNKAFVREGGGQFGPGERFYFHGENNSSGATLQKYDTVADKFTEVARNRGNLSSYYGSRTVVISEDGSRVFWSGSVYAGTDLAEQGSTTEIIYATTRDGRYAFGETKIYDVVEKRVAFGMPTATKVSAFNTTSNRLVVQQGQRLAFYQVATGTALPTPVLAAETITATTVALSWRQDSLQTGFTLQMRQTGSADWSDVSTAIASTAAAHTVSTLRPETGYEFRLKADSPAASSAWSNVVAITTRPAPPNPPTVSSLAEAGPTSVRIAWSVNGPYDSVTIERALSSSGPWTTVATLGAPSTTYTDSGLTTSTTYGYRLKVTRNGSDSAYTFTQFVTLRAPAGPALLSPPTSRTVLAGTAVTFNVSASGNPPPTFQWFREGLPIAGATNASFTLAAPSVLDAGTYRVVATNALGSVASPDFTLTVTPSTSRMINFSVLAQAGGGSTLTVGFTVAGGPKNVLVRGLGPTLSAVGVAGILTDPQLTLFRHAGGSTVALMSNNDWSTATNKNALLSATTRLTGLPFISDPSRDCAVLPALNFDGGYSVQIAGADASSGLALVEVYDADSGTPSRLGNISALTPVGPGTSLTAGFVISGTTRKTVLIRAVGPALEKVGVSGVLPDPQLTLFRQGTTPIPILTNNDWHTAANKAEVLSASAITVGLALDESSKDAAIVIALDPGGYTAQVSSADGSTGIALVEVYDVP
jgi:hypothetical protein